MSATGGKQTLAATAIYLQSAREPLHRSLLVYEYGPPLASSPIQLLGDLKAE
jgi:hypothetical protein